MLRDERRAEIAQQRKRKRESEKERIAKLEQELEQGKKLVHELIQMLDGEEESWTGRFHPTYIATCRTAHAEKIDKLNAITP